MTERLTQTDYGSLNNSYKTGVINLENEKIQLILVAGEKGRWKEGWGFTILNLQRNQS